MLCPEMKLALRSLQLMTYFVTEDELRFLQDLQAFLDVSAKALKTSINRYVHSPAMGLMSLESYLRSLEEKKPPDTTAVLSIHDALLRVFQEDVSVPSYYLILDAERWLTDVHVVRRFLEITHQLRLQPNQLKRLILVSNRKVMPDKLQRIFHVVQDSPLPDQEIEARVQFFSKIKNNNVPVPNNAVALFRGMLPVEIQRALNLSIVKTVTPGPPRIDPAVVQEVRRSVLKRTDLLTMIEVNESFEHVGGANRFKSWAEKTRACWTPEGQEFGLKPPRGVLLLGVWGCGKSLSVKALGKAWDLPVVQLEMGRLRSSAVGETEANVYRALRLISAVAPCIVFIDEAEKSLSGHQSSAQSDAGTTSRAIGILSTWMQETTDPICVAMTVNSVNNLPVEFINRMNDRFFFDLPTDRDRIDILRIHLAKVNRDSSNYNMVDLADAAKGLVGREIEQAISAAMVESFNQTSHEFEALLLRELAKKPRLLKTMVDEVKALTDWVGWDPDASDGIKARYASDPAQKASTLMEVHRDE